MKAGRGRVGVFAATAVGAPCAALTVGGALATHLPCAAPLAFAMGLHSIIPTWVALACGLPLLRSARTAWAVCAGLSLPLLVHWVSGSAS